MSSGPGAPRRSDAANRHVSLRMRSTRPAHWKPNRAWAARSHANRTTLAIRTSSTKCASTSAACSLDSPGGVARSARAGRAKRRGPPSTTIVRIALLPARTYVDLRRCTASVGADERGADATAAATPGRCVQRIATRPRLGRNAAGRGISLLGNSPSNGMRRARSVRRGREFDGRMRCGCIGLDEPIEPVQRSAS